MRLFRRKPDAEKRGGQMTPRHAPLPQSGTELPVPPPAPRPSATVGEALDHLDRAIADLRGENG